MAENDEILETGSSIIQRPVVLRSTSLEALGMQQKQQRRQGARSHPFFPRDWPVPVLDILHVLDIYERAGPPEQSQSRGNLHSCEREVSLDRSVTSGSLFSLSLM